MYAPSIFRENMMDDWFDGFDRLMNQVDREWNQPVYGKKNPLYGKNADRLMKTDVRELDGGYEVDIDLPGFKKDELNLQLESGYLTIQASKGLDKEQKDEQSGKIIRQERYAGSMSRTFYVGDEVTEEDIKAKFEDGVLRLEIPKKDPGKAVEQKKTIAIEG
ncbi:MAG: Hsp20/alpha crystallin family protein [Lachnospiraceae bacterium]|nr:Hsp20/alpha crystallin family protein [Lachnospiraceae bacterium]